MQSPTGYQDLVVNVLEKYDSNLDWAYRVAWAKKPRVHVAKSVLKCRLS